MGRYFKEIMIGILLTIVIILLLIIALYNYAPNSKQISELESYERSSQTSEVLQEISTSSITNSVEGGVIKSYTVGTGDLKNYERNELYDKGRGNPFENVGIELTNNRTNSINGTGQTTNSNSSGSTGYFNSTGKNK